MILKEKKKEVENKSSERRNENNNEEAFHVFDFDTNFSQFRDSSLRLSC